MRPLPPLLQHGVRWAGHPEPGFYRVRLTRGGPWVPAVIWRPCPMIMPHGGGPERLGDDFEALPGPEEWCTPTERSRPLRAMIHGVGETDPQELWVRGRRIGPAEYRWRTELGRWAQRYAPNQPEVRNPRNLSI